MEILDDEERIRQGQIGDNMFLADIIRRCDMPFKSKSQAGK
jgi:hypothetical protein